ncbi:50S ribosomal protein L31 [Candidatus Peregrinibacteria bacterium]|nr:50S ribosomal protein L31 [Candidatus Peregrinibacteria bacterium]
MKTEIHPKSHPVVFIDDTSGAEFIAMSTLTSEETKKINGVDHYIIKVETSSATHPFYTGTQKSANKGNQVAKYLEKVKKAQAANKTTKQPEKNEGEKNEEQAKDKSTKKTS